MHLKLSSARGDESIQMVASAEQAISAGWLLIGPFDTNFSSTELDVKIFFFRKMFENVVCRMYVNLLQVIVHRPDVCFDRISFT